VPESPIGPPVGGPPVGPKSKLPVRFATEVKTTELTVSSVVTSLEAVTGATGHADRQAST